MTGNDYLLLAYVVGLGLVWGYALLLAFTSRSLRKREADRT